MKFVEDPGADELAVQRLLAQQVELRSNLVAFLSSFPSSGLYADEVDKEPHTFARFAAHVRAVLASSPRAVLLRSLDAELLRLLDDSPNTGFLFETLDLGRDATLLEVRKAMARFMPGQLHHEWRSSIAASLKATALGDARVRARMERGLVQKAAARGQPHPSAEELAAALADVEAADAARCAAAARRAAEFGPRVDEDEQYKHFTKVQQLWQDSGVQALWARFEAADTEEGSERRRRGGHFEHTQAQVCLGLVTARLARASSHSSAGGFFELDHILGRWGRRHPRIRGVRGAVWTDAYGRQTGEVDLVLFEEAGDASTSIGSHKRAVAGRVLALCEFKSGCFEIAAALRQHEPNLAAAQAGGRGAPLLRAGADPSAPLLAIPTGASLPVFVATLIPPHRFAIGAEASLVSAMGRAVFAQGSQRVTRNRIRAESAASGPVVSRAPLCNEVQLENGAVAGDVHAIEAQVRLRMGSRLNLSPLGLLRSVHGVERVLVLGHGEAGDTAMRDWMRREGASATPTPG